MRTIYDRLHPLNNPGLKEIFNLLENEPDLWKIIEMHKQILPSAEEISKIALEFDKVIPQKKKYASKIGKSFNPKLIQYNIFAYPFG